MQVDEETIRAQSRNYPLQFTVLKEPETLAGSWSLDELPVGPSHDLSTDSSFSVTVPAVTTFRLWRTMPAVNVEDAEATFEFALRGNFPNPFGAVTTLVLDIPESADVEVVLYDVLGRNALRLPLVSLSGGANRRVPIDGSNLAAGIYSYSVRARMQSTTAVETGRMILVR
jgi:hypothetical protein